MMRLLGIAVILSASTVRLYSVEKESWCVRISFDDQSIITERDYPLIKGDVAIGDKVRSRTYHHGSSHLVIDDPGLSYFASVLAWNDDNSIFLEGAITHVKYNFVKYINGNEVEWLPNKNTIKISTKLSLSPGIKVPLGGIQSEVNAGSVDKGDMNKRVPISMCLYYIELIKQ